MTTATPQALAEHALSVSTSEHCLVIVQDSTSANLRWANNTLTTNGVMHGVGVTVISFQGAGNASVSGTATSHEQVTALVEQADAGARAAQPAEDRADLVAGSAAADWDDPPSETSIEVYRDFAAALGEEFERAERESRILYGFVSKQLYAEGLYCRADDRGDPVVQLAPPLICTQEHFDEMEQILRTVLDKAWGLF